MTLKYTKELNCKNIVLLSKDFLRKLHRSFAYGEYLHMFAACFKLLLDKKLITDVKKIGLKKCLKNDKDFININFPANISGKYFS